MMVDYKQNNHKSLVLWFTGLSAIGKLKLPHTSEEELHKVSSRIIVLDRTSTSETIL